MLSNAYNTLLLERDDPVLDPDPPAAHHVGQHHVGCQPITHNSNLVRTCHASLWVLAEVRQDLVTTAWLLHGMREDINTGGFLDLGGETPIDIVACCTGSV